MDELASAFERAIEGGRFDASRFFKEWYDQPDRAFLFLFTKNLSVTNLQFAELVSLLRTYITDTSTKRRKAQLLFLSTRSIKDTIQDLATEKGSIDKLDYRRARHLAELYADLLGRIAVFDAFHGSAALFLPPNLEVDLLRVSALSGYIHSCGRNVLIRSTDKVTEPYLADAIERTLARYPPRTKLFLAAYAHEDFTSYDRASSSRLRHGLDEVKLHLEKFYVAGERLPKVLLKLRAMFAERLVIPPPGDYRRAHIAFRSQEEVDANRTL
ncbi:MAG TPA: hypothetical protein VLF66_08375 [Thermoanaerobaculia bacterium]|nr:hypothetical protein [Thermoanaerobaculia bacterium]